MSLIAETMAALVKRCEDNAGLRRVGTDAEPFLSLPSPQDPAQEAGRIELWVGDGSTAIDRVVHIVLRGGPVETRLFWVFCADDSPAPHYHAQLVSVPGGRFVHNVDLLPRVDLALHPAYAEEVFGPLGEARAALVGNPEHACARGGAPGLARRREAWPGS